MINIYAAFLLSILNYTYAIVIYLSLHGWLVAHEPGGMQLLAHLIITAPAIIISTAWFFILSKKGIIRKMVWKINLLGLFIPVMSVQTGVTYYHYDIAGLTITSAILVVILALFIYSVRQHVNS